MSKGWRRTLCRICNRRKEVCVGGERIRWSRPCCKVCKEGIIERIDSDPPLPSTCYSYTFVIPKSTKKLLMIFHLVDFNEVLLQSPPPGFSLCSSKQLADRLCSWPSDALLFCTHVDLKNAFWSFVLPRRRRKVFALDSVRTGERVCCIGCVECLLAENIRHWCVRWLCSELFRELSLPIWSFSIISRIS